MDRRQWRQAGEAGGVIDARGTSMLRRHGMVAVGVGFKTKAGVPTDEIAVKAFVPRKLPEAQIAPERLIPKTIGRVSTDVEEMRPPTAPVLFDSAFALAALGMGNRLRQRPISGGDSVSRFPGTLGTIGAIVRDRFSSRTLILSCNHVLAALNWARAGDPIVQPAAGDGGIPFSDRCGTLLRWVPLSFGGWGANRVDAAVAIADIRAVPWIDFVGLPAGVRSGNSLAPGAPVFKVGRTTRVTVGSVAAVHVSGWITYSYWPPASAFFRDQIVTTGAAGFGDSGALLFDQDRNAAGLLFGGSPTHTFYNDIVNVQNELGITLTTA